MQSHACSIAFYTLCSAPSYDLLFQEDRQRSGYQEKAHPRRASDKVNNVEHVSTTTTLCVIVIFVPSSIPDFGPSCTLPYTDTLDARTARRIPCECPQWSRRQEVRRPCDRITPNTIINRPTRHRFELCICRIPLLEPERRHSQGDRLP